MYLALINSGGGLWCTAELMNILGSLSIYNVQETIEQSLFCIYLIYLIFKAINIRRKGDGKTQSKRTCGYS